jgi:hypothetical protein
MNENEISVEEGFYREIAIILGCDAHNYRPYPYSKRTRWNNREPGNGRYPGHGLIRRYSSTNISVSLHTPYVVGYFTSEQQALDAIKNALDIL